MRPNDRLRAQAVDLTERGDWADQSTQSLGERVAGLEFQGAVSDAAGRASDQDS